MNELYDIYTSLAHAEGILLYISFAIRFLLPILALLLLFRCGKSLLSDHPSVIFNYFRGGFGVCDVEMH